MAGLLESLASDYRRHHASLRSLGFWAMANYRFGRWTSELPPGLRLVGDKIYGGLLSVIEMTSGIIIYRETQIGEAIHLVHGWNIKIHPKTVIGDRVGIMHDVTLGATPDDSGAPTIGNDVFIGAGAKVLGAVRIGDRVRIAANSLVISDVPADATAIGVPAKILRYTGRPTEVPLSKTR
jgi:serine O-acetyltransferase